ncbi:MAG: Gfo/Idh/MocA family oxidoreductase [Nitrospirae bacterium]|nr:Gfo/Idh/MocA family oxidoreductase [Nitrospirota bacterium]
MINIGVIGYGYWGPNIIRNFSGIKGVKIVSLCDTNHDALNRARGIYPNLKTTIDYREITTSPEIDAVAVITPVFTHYELAKNALENGKHIFVEKPFTSTVKEAEELIELAEKKNLKIMVDHTFLFTGAVRKIKELIDDNVLGDLYYYDSIRVNLGLFQHDINVIWDLAPHDLSIMDYVIKDRPAAISANGVDHFGRELENIAYVTVYFNNNMIAHFNVNWLSPVKIRQTLIGGEKKMLVWNDLELDEKIKVYNKGVNIETKEGLYNLLVDYRSGDMLSPRVDQTEALKLEAEYFLDCISRNSTPINDGHAGLRIVKMLEAANMSLRNRGKLINY